MIKSQRSVEGEMSMQSSASNFQMQGRSQDPRESLEKMRRKLSNSKSGLMAQNKPASRSKAFMNLGSPLALPSIGSVIGPTISSNPSTLLWERGAFENVIHGLMGKGKKKALKIWAIVLSLLVTAAAANFFLVQNQSSVMEQFGVKNREEPLSAPIELSNNEKARFWAMAAWDNNALMSHYPKTAGQLIDPQNAENHLRRLWKDLSPNLKKELQALHHARKGGVFK
jgi:hypothetical protein